jgi:hypothetical protein
MPWQSYSYYFLAGHGDTWFTTLWATAVGAFVGAAVAFAIDWLRRIREEKRRRIGAANVALLTLKSMWWEFYNYESQVVHPALVDDRRELPLWILIRPAVRQASNLQFDISALSFLLELEQPDLLPKLVLQERRYREFGTGLEQRDVVMARVRDLMAARQIGATRYATDEELKQAIGVRGIGEVRTSTAAIVRALYLNLHEIASTYYELLLVLRKQFGKKAIVAFDLEQAKMEATLTPTPQEWAEAAIARVNSWPAG